MKGLLMPNETMPDSCSECPCFRTDEYNGHEASECMCKLITFGDNDGWIYHTRPNWCPLVEIVRCKDCKYCKVYDDIPWCDRLTGTFRVKEESFCSYARRRTDD